MHRRSWFESNGDCDGDTPLHFAAAAGRSSLLFNHLSLGYNINSVNYMGWTPLMHAARNGHVACVKLLLDFGADVTCRNCFGICSLSLAAASGDLETVRVVLKTIFRKRFEICDFEQPVSPLVFAILFNHSDILKYLSLNAFNLNKISILGDLSPAMFASILSNKETMDILNRRGINPLKIALNCTQTSKNAEICNLNKTFQVPSLLVTKDSMVPETPVSSPNILYSFISPLGSSVEDIETRLRKFSNLSISSPRTPGLSPITRTNTPRRSVVSYSTSTKSESPVNEYLNKRFTISPSASKDTISSKSNSNIFTWLAPSDIGNCKVRSSSHCNPTTFTWNLDAEDEDEVFETRINCNTSKTSHKNCGFIELLRKNSLDSCVSLFEKHEIDMDMFLTLTKKDLTEIGVNWEKRDHVLELIYLLNKRM